MSVFVFILYILYIQYVELRSKFKAYSEEDVLPLRSYTIPFTVCYLSPFLLFLIRSVSMLIIPSHAVGMPLVVFLSHGGQAEFEDFAAELVIAILNKQLRYHALSKVRASICSVSSSCTHISYSGIVIATFVDIFLADLKLRLQFSSNSLQRKK